MMVNIFQYLKKVKMREKSIVAHSVRKKFATSWRTRFEFTITLVVGHFDLHMPCLQLHRPQQHNTETFSTLTSLSFSFSLSFFYLFSPCTPSTTFPSSSYTAPSFFHPLDYFWVSDAHVYIVSLYIYIQKGTSTIYNKHSKLFTS